MTEPAPQASASQRCVVTVRFPPSVREYDYFCNFPVAQGQNVVVETRRGEATVQVLEVKATSERAEKSILRLAEKGRDY